MTTRSNPVFEPDYAVAPGETLEEILVETGMSQTALARRLGVSIQHVNRVINGKAPISAELALGFEKVLGGSSDFWVRREAQYRADLARIEEKANLSSEATVKWAQGFPIAQLKDRECIPKDARGSDLVASMLRFFGIADPSVLQVAPAAFRKSSKFDCDPNALAAWLRIGELEANAIECADFDAGLFREALQEIRGLTRLEPDEWREPLIELCARAGVAVVIVEGFPRAPVNGATRWLSPTKALLQLSLRYSWEDIFWFTFFHESGHILLHRRKEIFIESSSREGDADWSRLEREADAFAAKTLIPPEYDDLIRGMAVEEIEPFADSIGVATAVVIGRLKHEGLIPWNQHNSFRRRFVFRK